MHLPLLAIWLFSTTTSWAQHADVQVDPCCVSAFEAHPFLMDGGVDIVTLPDLGEVVIDWLKVYEAWAIPVVATTAILIWITVKLFEIFATKRSRLVFLARARKFWSKVKILLKSK